MDAERQTRCIGLKGLSGDEENSGRSDSRATIHREGMVPGNGHYRGVTPQAGARTQHRGTAETKAHGTLNGPQPLCGTYASHFLGGLHIADCSQRANLGRSCRQSQPDASGEHSRVSLKSLPRRFHELPTRLLRTSLPSRKSPVTAGPVPERILPVGFRRLWLHRKPPSHSPNLAQSAYRSDDPSDPFDGQAELSVEQLVAEVQARNPSLQAACRMAGGGRTLPAGGFARRPDVHLHD